ncbi:MAG: right-handed parallel beta-helix repeat-containing protein [Acidobacteria bacterium]|nr:right-handed parallel beta-helix repeat-containing protein [Acidobacteriota bacterium]
MIKKNDVSRRQFLSRTALTLPVAAAAIPAAMEITSPMKANAASYPSIQQSIPNRTLPNRVNIPTWVEPVTGLDLTEKLDCSQAIQDAITRAVTNHGGGTVLIPRQHTGGTYSNDGSSTNRCIYKIDPMRVLFDNSDPSDPKYCAIEIKNNYIRLECEPGVTLESMTINRGNPIHPTRRAYMLYVHEVQGIEIVNGSYVGERQTHILSGSPTDKNHTDEWCHGLQILGVNNITVRGAHFSSFTGDGICVGNINGTGSTNVYLCDVLCTDNRRQGLSLTQGDGIYVYDSEFSYTYGTLPMNGIDIEPEGSSTVQNVTIDNCIIKGNEGNGIECNTHDDNVSISNVDITNCMFSYNFFDGFYAHRYKGTISGGSVFGCAFYQNGNFGLSIVQGVTGYTIGAPHVDGIYTNSFANNGTSSNTIVYPNTTLARHSGYWAGVDDMNADSGAQSANIWQNNYFFSS